MVQVQANSEGIHPIHIGRIIGKTGLVVGLLDATAAMTHYYLASGKNPLRVWYYVASAVFGPDAYNGGLLMVAIGLFFHLCVAMSVVAGFVLLYRQFSAIRQNTVLSGLVYGLAVWLLMNFVVVPLTLVTRGPFNPVNAGIGILIHLFVIGLPTALLVQHYSQRKLASGL